MVSKSMGKRKQSELSEGDASASDLPPGWCSIKLSAIAEVRLGRQRSPQRATGKHMRPYMRAANVKWGGISLHDVKEMDFTPNEAEVYELRDGDILLAEASGSPNEVGKPALWRNEVPGACFQNTLIRVRASKKLERFLYLHFFKDAFTGRFGRAARGVGIHHLGGQALADWQVVVPPLDEQERIVEAIETHFSKLDAAVEGLKRVQANLKRYRASVLKAAVEGRLVPTEAALAQQESRDYEPASVLLERILTERRRRWEQAELAKLNAKGKPPRDDQWKARYQEPAAPDTTNLPALPEGWCWATVDQLADVQGGIQKGKQRRPSEKLREVPYLRVANVQRGYLDLSQVKSIPATEDEIELLRLQVGDVLFNEGGDRDKLGRGWIWNGEVEECIHQNHVFRARLLTNDLIPHFLSWYGNSSGQQYFFEQGKQTTNLASLNLTKLRGLPVPIPPKIEQKRIATEVEKHLSDIDAVQSSTAANIIRCHRLRQSILKWAFEGKLVDQDPTDEPASVLLERIRVERAAKAVPTKSRHKTDQTTEGTKAGAHGVVGPPPARRPQAEDGRGGPRRDSPRRALPQKSPDSPRRALPQKSTKKSTAT